MGMMAKNNNLDKNYAGLKRLIKHMELWKRQQKLLVHSYPQYSVDRAISNAKFNTLSIILDFAETYLIGGHYSNEIFKELERRL